MIIRKIRGKEFSLLPEIEEDAAQAFLDAGMPGINDLESAPSDVYRNMPECNTVLVAVEKDGSEERLLGFIAGHESDGQAYLREVSVRYSESGKGVGGSLVKALTEWAVEEGFSSVTLTTFRDLPFNAPFYEKLGFTKFVPLVEDWPELLAVRQKEKQEGLNTLGPRVCMKMECS